jgi:hypothetical protein
VADPVVEILDVPPSLDRWLKRDEAVRLVAGCGDFHVRLFVLLGLQTAARSAAILGLPWDGAEFDCGRLDYGTGRGNKGRSNQCRSAPS